MKTSELSPLIMDIPPHRADVKESLPSRSKGPSFQDEERLAKAPNKPYVASAARVQMGLMQLPAVHRFSRPPRIALLTEWIGKPVDALVRYTIKGWERNAAIADVIVITDNPAWLGMVNESVNIHVLHRPKEIIDSALRWLFGVPAGKQLPVDTYFYTNIRPALAGLLEAPNMDPGLLSGSVSMYTHWGFVENDIYLGNMSFFFPPKVLREHDAFSTVGTNVFKAPNSKYHSVEEQIFRGFRLLAPFGPTFFINTVETRLLWHAACNATLTWENSHDLMCLHAFANSGQCKHHHCAGPRWWFTENVFARAVSELPLRMYQACCGQTGVADHSDSCKLLWLDGEVVRLCTDRRKVVESNLPRPMKPGQCAFQNQNESSSSLFMGKQVKQAAAVKSTSSMCMQSSTLTGRTRPKYPLQAIELCHNGCTDFGFHISSPRGKVLVLTADHESATMMSNVPERRRFIIREPASHKANFHRSDFHKDRTAAAFAGTQQVESKEKPVPIAFELFPKAHGELGTGEIQVLLRALAEARKANLPFALVEQLDSAEVGKNSPYTSPSLSSPYTPMPPQKWLTQERDNY